MYQSQLSPGESVAQAMLTCFTEILLKYQSDKQGSGMENMSNKCIKLDLL